MRAVRGHPRGNGDDGKAEIQFDDGSVARLSPDSTLTLTSVGGQGRCGDCARGRLGYFELQGGGQGGQMRVAFGDSVATATGFTVMRIKLDHPPGEIAVFSATRTWSAETRWLLTCTAGRA